MHTRGTDVSESPTGVWSPGRRALTSGMVLIVTLVASEALAIATVLPKVEAELGDLPLYGWVFSAFFLGNLVGVVVAGRMADRMAPVIPFVIGLVLFIIGLAAGGAAGSMLVLVLARGVQGLGAGALPAIAYVCIGRAYADHDRPRMFAVLSTAWVLPSAIGPGLAAFVGEHWSWRWVFLGLLPLVVVAGGIATWALRILPAPAHPTGARADAPGPKAPVLTVFVLAASSALVLSALTDIRAVRSWIVLPIAGAVSVVAYRRLTPDGTLRAARGVPSTIACQGLFAFAFFSADAFIPLALTNVRGTSVAYAGVVITAVTLGWTTGSWVQDRWIRRIGPRPLVRMGLSGLMIGALGMALVLLPGVPVALALVFWTLGGFGAGFTFGPLSAAMLSAAAPGAEGQTTAAFQLTEVLGVALGTGTAGAIVAVGSGTGLGTGGSVAIVFVLAALVGGVGLLTTPHLPATVLATEVNAHAEDTNATEPAPAAVPAAGDADRADVPGVAAS